MNIFCNTISLQIYRKTMKYCNLTIFSGIINSLVENYNISLTWIKMNLAATPGDDFPYHYSRARENSEVVIIYPEYPRIMDMSDMGVNHGQQSWSISTGTCSQDLWNASVHSKDGVTAKDASVGSNCDLRCNIQKARILQWLKNIVS